MTDETYFKIQSSNFQEKIAYYPHNINTKKRPSSLKYLILQAWTKTKYEHLGKLSAYIPYQFSCASEVSSQKVPRIHKTVN